MRPGPQCHRGTQTGGSSGTVALGRTVGLRGKSEEPYTVPGTCGSLVNKCTWAKKHKFPVGLLRSGSQEVMFKEVLDSEDLPTLLKFGFLP